MTKKCHISDSPEDLSKIDYMSTEHHFSNQARKNPHFQKHFYNTAKTVMKQSNTIFYQLQQTHALFIYKNDSEYFDVKNCYIYGLR